MDTQKIKVTYSFSKYKYDESERTISLDVYYKIAEALLSDRNTPLKEKMKRTLVRHIGNFESLNNHIASSVQIISIESEGE